MGLERGLFKRTELLLGNDIMDRIANMRVIIFGVGGVGSWCAESLVRSGIKHLTIVDSDRICVTNINRQLMATTKTVGQVKVDVLKSRLLEINPTAEITALQQIYSAETSDSFHIESYDYIIDAIDSLENKVDLIRQSTKTDATFFSSMGAALKMDPMKIKTAEFWKVIGCPLAAALRRRIKKGEKLTKKFMCVYSEELLENKGANSSCGTENCLCPKTQEGPGDANLVNHEWCSKKARINGTLAHTTAIFGFTLAGLVMQDIYNKWGE
ncbi:tRNA threonylcarbamoyladenosine dehydratase [uncultured Bacteroides sp.]|uniref:tRNA threonylcarbamoyladenosine dehydratase n=1 Tax=uncultured Bacteroides sp. TaxID=162156 RepID=UPI002AA6D922|nr:tRNA threonylcarbamoyladenosine dehydratase [uncultured Bacteroides sp.]